MVIGEQHYAGAHSAGMCVVPSVVPVWYVTNPAKVYRNNEEKEGELENDQYYIKGYESCYGFWLKFGGMHPNSVLLPVWYMSSAITLLILLLLTAIRMREKELLLAMECFHFVIFIMAEIVAIFTFKWKSRTIVDLYRCIGKGFYDYEGTLDEECQEFIARLSEETVKKRKLVHHLFVFIVMTACTMITVLRPIAKILLGEPYLGTPEDGIVRMTIISSWTPFDKWQWYTIAWVNILEYTVSWITPGIVFGSTFLVVFSMEALCVQLRILSCSQRTLFSRAARLDMPMEEALKLCLRHSVRHHQLLFRFKDGIEEIVSLPGFTVFLGFTVMMCISGYIFTLKSVSLFSKLVFGFFLLAETVMFFMICYYGEEIQQLSVEVGEQLYETDWLNYSKLLKNYVLIIQIRSRKKMEIELLGLMDFSRETFSNISSTSYSYFNLIRELK